MKTECLLIFLIVYLIKDLINELFLDFNLPSWMLNVEWVYRQEKKLSEIDVNGEGVQKEVMIMNPVSIDDDAKKMCHWLTDNINGPSRNILSLTQVLVSNVWLTLATAYTYVSSRLRRHPLKICRVQRHNCLYITFMKTTVNSTSVYIATI